MGAKEDARPPASCRLAPASFTTTTAHQSTDCTAITTNNTSCLSHLPVACGSTDLPSLNRHSMEHTSHPQAKNIPGKLQQRWIQHTHRLDTSTSKHITDYSRQLTHRRQKLPRQVHHIITSIHCVQPVIACSLQPVTPGCSINASLSVQSSRPPTTMTYHFLLKSTERPHHPRLQRRCVGGESSVAAVPPVSGNQHR